MAENSKAAHLKLDSGPDVSILSSISLWNLPRERWLVTNGCRP